VKYPSGSELPPDLQPVHRRAVRLEWISIVYTVTAVVAIFFTLGSSQAMKGAWLEDVLSLAPPIAFLVAARVRYKRPNRDFPYGYHRAVEVAYLVAALALLSMGIFLIVDSALKLVDGDHPPIGMVELFDWQVWLGWLMIAALVYSVIPPVILGRLKKDLAAELHDKVLFADAKMNKANWMTGTAAIIGVVGLTYTAAAVKDILDGRPRRDDEKGVHPLVEQVRETVAELDWIREAAVRMRELGHLLSVEVLAVPRDDADLLDRVEDAVERIQALDWKLQDVVVAVVRELEDAPDEVMVRPREITRG
jgi:divalent metal cation (Fe/Co/Zn/Cd) transporter